MSIINEITNRKSKRALDSKKIPDSVIQNIMEAAVLAPSCFNNQPWRFIVVNGDEKLSQVKTALTDGNYWAKKSPAIVVVSSHRDLDCKLSDKRDYTLFDCGLATENLILQAFKEGLIAHPIAGFNPKTIKDIFSIPEDYIVITLVVLGYPGNIDDLNENHRLLEDSPRERYPLKENVFFNQGW